MIENKLIIKKRGEDNYKTFSIRVKEDTVKKIDEIAVKTDRSKNELVGLFLEYAIDNCEIE